MRPAIAATIVKAMLLCTLSAAVAGCTALLPKPASAAGESETERAETERAETERANAGLRRLAATTDVCHPSAAARQPQHVIGYGSLMQDESRRRTTPSAGPARPVLVNGMRRGWFARGNAIGFDTTYLGAVVDAGSQINAVVYAVDAAELDATDRRESFYCRRLLSPSGLTVLDAGGAPIEGPIWIYVNKPEGIATASERQPIVQSYVDIFASGCIELEQRHRLSGFARQCLTTTTNWSTHWVNDRIYPRRPFIYEPSAREIDELLDAELPAYFRSIRLESKL